MSGYITHMAVGAAGGAVLVRVAPELIPGDPAVLAVVLPLASALAATWPDLDHPEAWASRRVWWVTGSAGAVATFAIAPALAPDGPVAMAALLVFGALLGVGLGALLLSALRVAVGGHRGGTHGLIAPGLLLAVAALVGWPWAALPLLLAWGWLMHVLADVVTPGGWRPLAPLRGPTVRLPRSLARHGETLISCAALTVLAAALGLPALLAPAAGVVAALALRARRQARGWR